MSHSGRNLLAEIDRALSASRDEFRAIDIELQSASATLGRTRRREAGIYQQLARLRLEDIAAARFVDAVDNADKRAGELLAERDNELAALESDIGDRQRQLADIEAQRQQALAAVADAETALDELLSGVDAALASDDEYLRQTGAVQQALETAANAQAKTAEAQARREEKRQPYEHDSLFMYLWRRGYGTSEYRAGLVARFFDGLVARHIRFEPARRNYYALNEIPRRLASHTARLEEKATALAATLADYERAADVAAGCEPLEAALGSAREQLQHMETRLEVAQEDFDARIAEREQYASASDPLFRRAMQVLDEQFRAEPVPQLRREAALTANIEDDALVEQLASVREEQQRLSHYIEDHSDVHARRAARVNELTTLRRRYRDRNFDAENSLIDDQGKVGVMLGEFLRGLVSSDQLWQAIRHAQRFRRSRTAARGGGVRIGGMRIPNVPRSVRLPRSGGFGSSGGFGGGGGGFRSKGGF